MYATLYALLETPERTRFGLYLHVAIYAAIVLNITALFLETVASLEAQYRLIFDTIETVTIYFFAGEYLLRLLVAGGNERYRGVTGRFRYIFSPMALIDLAAILPFFLRMAGIELTFLRSLRLFRVFKLFRMTKYSRFFELLLEILREKKEEFLAILAFTGIFLVMLSAVVYYFEHEAQPEVFSSMPQALWWAVATLTTVGYGDMYPITVGGKIITALVTILGIAFVALPGGLFAEAFWEELQSRRHGRRERRERD